MIVILLIFWFSAFPFFSSSLISSFESINDESSEVEEEIKKLPKEVQEALVITITKI